MTNREVPLALKEAAFEVCKRIAEGRSLKSVCKDDDINIGISNFLCVSGQDPEVAEKYEKAILERTEMHREELLDIIDNGTNDWMEKNDPENPGYKVNGEAIQRAKLRVETRKWLMAKMYPRKYGDKLAIGGAEDLPPVSSKTTNVLDVSGMTEEQLEALQAALLKTMDGK